MAIAPRLTLGWFCLTAVVAAAAAEDPKQIADAFYRASYIVLNARKATELDASLIELRRFADNYERVSPAGSDRENVLKRLHDATRFLQQWQNYLSAVESNKFDDAIRALNQLALTEQSPLGVPRSEILARVHSLEGKEKAQANSYAESILQNIRSLDDLPSALIQLRSEMDQLSRSQALRPVVNSLDALCKTYLTFRQGTATTLPPGSWQNTDTHPVVARLRAELLLQLLPRVLGVEKTDPPKAGETVEAYLVRLRAAAIAHKDFDLLGRIASAGREISFSSAGSVQNSIGQDYAFCVFWREAQNAERARRFFEAALAYRRALSAATPAIPVEFIGERLQTIEKEHPEEYKQAVETIQRYGNPETAPNASTWPVGLTSPAVNSRPTPLQSPSPVASATP